MGQGKRTAGTGILRPLFGGPTVSRSEKLWTILNNMIPILGIVFLGWNAGPVLLLLWLDGWLGVWEIALAACVEISTEDPDVIPTRIRGIRRALTWAVTYFFVVLFSSIPSFLAWMGVQAMTASYYDHGLFSVIASGGGILWAVGANVILRAAQSVHSVRRRSGEKMSFTLEEKYHLLFFKALAMMALAHWMGSVGPVGLAVYVALVSVFFAWAEMNPNLILHLLQVGRGKEDMGNKPGRPDEDRGTKS